MSVVSRLCLFSSKTSWQLCSCPLKTGAMLQSIPCNVPTEWAPCPRLYAEDRALVSASAIVLDKVTKDVKLRRPPGSDFTGLKDPFKLLLWASPLPPLIVQFSRRPVGEKSDALKMETTVLGNVWALPVLDVMGPWGFIHIRCSLWSMTVSGRSESFLEGS